MYKMIVMDLDGTLCQINEGPEEITKKYLYELKNKGYILSIASGKPVYYLTGFIRALNLPGCYLIGENGARIVKGYELPPKASYLYPLDKDIRLKLFSIKKKIEEKIPDIFFQNNEIMVTPFPKCEEEFDIIDTILKNTDTEGLSVFRHKDSFDIIPKGMDKGISLKYLYESLNIEKDSVISIGDDSNDLSMFNVSGLSISIGDKLKDKSDLSFSCIEEALSYILNL